MIRQRLRSGELLRTVVANCSARLLAIVGLTLATILVARIGGPAAVGEYALLRMIPGLVGVLCVLGLPGALAYFLAEPRRDLPRLWPTLMAIGAAGALLGTIAWLAAAPLLARVFFPSEPVWLIAAAGATVPRIFLIEAEYALAMREAEAAWVRSLLGEIAAGTLSGVDGWRAYHETGHVPADFARLLDEGVSPDPANARPPEDR